MRRPLTPALAELLAYLGEIGYGDIYVRAAAHAASTSSGASRMPPQAAPDLVVPSAPPPAQSAQSAQPVQQASAKTPDTEERAAQLAALAAMVAGCTRCRLSEGRSKVVFGSGNPNAELMLIGEAPGAEEDRQGLPFVGAAGELLTKIIQAIDLQRDDIYIAN
ncbi:MAG TPA: uracil-DNA glycosylase, partial [Thermoanaerobaculia bacterium]